VPRRHAALAVAVTLVWGVNFVVIHVGLDSFPPLLFAALRFLAVAVPGVLLFAPPRVPARLVIAVGLFTSTGQFALLFVGMEQGVPAGLASLVLQLQVVFTIVLAVVFLGERPGRAQMTGIAVALAGMAIIAAGRSAAVGLGALALVVGAAACWGVGNVATRMARAPDALALLAWSSLVPPIPLALLSLTFEGPTEIVAALGGVDASGILALTYIVVLSTVFGYGAWNWLLSRHPASHVVPFTLLVPVVGIAAAWLALAERPNAAELIGAAVVLLGLALSTGVLRLPWRQGRAASARAEA